MRICLIFNPAAKGDKAQRFRRHLDEISGAAHLKLTTSAGDARRLAKEAVDEGFDTVVAAGGDGTVNEVLNGIGAATNGFDRARLAVLPLGTVNVFARELLIPAKVEPAWSIIQRGREARIDLPRVEFTEGEKRCSRYFAQLAGAGLDARAIELVQWRLKKKIGPFAYMLAGLQALAGPIATIEARSASISCRGGLVLIGNGQLYGGPYRLFPQADLTDGLLEVCVFPRVNWITLARCGPSLLLRKGVPKNLTTSFQAARLTLDGTPPAPLEVDGEWIGRVPAEFTIARGALRVVSP